MPTPKSTPSIESHIVRYHPEAVAELLAYEKALIKKALNSVSLLQNLGDKTIPPHSDKVAGATKLRELRPGGGKALIRPLYYRRSTGHYEILAVGPEAVTDPRGFNQAVKRAQKRAKEDYGDTV